MQKRRRPQREPSEMYPVHATARRVSQSAGIGPTIRL